MIPWGTRQGGARVTGLIVSDQNDGEFGASVQVQTAHDRAHGPDLKIKPLSTRRFDCACLNRVRGVVIQGPDTPLVDLAQYDYISWLGRMTPNT